MKKAGPARTIRYLGNFEDHVTDNAQVKHIFAGPLRVATRVVGPGSNIGTYFVHGDHLGSLNVLTNSASDEVQRLTYQPFGTIQSNAGTADFDFYRFTGQELDPETGLYYYGARYYHADLGRFVSTDSVIPDPFDPQSLNRYSYVLNNPLRFADPTGLVPEIAIGVTVPAGGPVGVAVAVVGTIISVFTFGLDDLLGDDDEPPPPPLPPNVAGGFGGQIPVGGQSVVFGAVTDPVLLALEREVLTSGSPSLQQIPDPAVFGLPTTPEPPKHTDVPILTGEGPFLGVGRTSRYLRPIFAGR